jgi:hypothetical protein
MKARCLTVMATRDEDQELVLKTASQHGIKSANVNDWSRTECIIPCFGWHPWFAHQMYISSPESEDDKQQPLTADAKIKHYQQVLQPSRPDLSEEDLRIFNALPDPQSFSVFLAQTRKYLQFQKPGAPKPGRSATRTLRPEGERGGA